MSQAKPQPVDVPDNPGEPLRGADQLVEYFASAAKPRSEFRVGTEHEKFGTVRSTRAPLPFEGPNGIETILNEITADPGPGEPVWIPVYDHNRTVALYCEDGSAITLEPGGQIELSGIPLANIHETSREVERHLALLRRTCLPHGIAFIGIGFHPVARWQDMPTVPKNRYAVLQSHLAATGQRGLDMMKRTCTVQANLDFSDETDMVMSFRTALAVSPLVAALFANGPFKEGKPSGVVSERLLTWFDTDPARCGYPEIVFEDGFGYERWVEWALDVPMLFIRRDGIHHNFSGASFRDFLQSGIGGIRATLRDFEDHLTTVFTEVRLKRYLEMRSADCGPWSRICALPALWKGVLYDITARAAADDLMAGPSAAELAQLQYEVAFKGFKAKYRGRSVFDLSGALVSIASEGLRRLNCRDDNDEDERRYLRPLWQLLEEGNTFGERLLRLYRTSWAGSLEPMWDDIEFLPQTATAAVKGG
jgi:glutamate--cysteine ligase